MSSLIKKCCAATSVFKYIVEYVCAGDTVLVDLNYLPELPSRSVDGVATVCFFSDRAASDQGPGHLTDTYGVVYWVQEASTLSCVPVT